MAKIIKISKHKLDLAKVELTSSSLLIGRSPMCDQVLRVPGVRPVHFLLEWLGEGEFNPNEGIWTLFDLNKFVNQFDGNNFDENVDFSAEGIVIGTDQEYLGLNWELVTDRLGSANLQKGIISSQFLTSTKKRTDQFANQYVLEVVSIHKKDQKVLDIIHFFDQYVDLKKMKDQNFPFFLDWKSLTLATIQFTEVPKAIFNLKGQRLNTSDSIDLHAPESCILHYNDFVYFVRFVARVEYVIEKKKFEFNLFSILSLILFFAFLSMLLTVKKMDYITSDHQLDQQLRIVKIYERPIEPSTESISLNSEVKPQIQKEEVKPLPTVKPEEAIAPQMEKNTNVEKIDASHTEKVAAQNFNTTNNKKEKEKGLDSPGKSSDVNAVGLLGKLNLKSKKKSNGDKTLSAETISKTIVENTAASQDGKGVVVSTVESGIVDLKKKINANNGNNSRNNDRSATESNLMEAQTTLKSAKEINAGNSEGIAKIGKVDKSKMISEVLDNGSNLNSEGNGKNAQGKLGKVETSKLKDATEVVGGLTKAQVFEVINSHRREIRTCYESALLVRNDLNGILRMTFVINPEGVVNDIKIVSTEMESSVLESCVIQVIRNMIFPASKNHAPTTVIYPFAFRRSS